MKHGTACGRVVGFLPPAAASLVPRNQRPTTNNQRRAAARRASGFTLIEVMLAMLITVSITTGIWMVFRRSFDMRDRAMEIAERYRGIRIAMDRMARDIEMAFLTLRQGPTKTTQTIFKHEDSSPCDVLIFSTIGHIRMIRDADESDQNEVQFYCDDHPDEPGQIALFRREQRRIDEDPEKGGYHQILLPDVSSLDFRFYDHRTDEWTEEWDSSQIERALKLPQLVRIELTVDTPSGEEEIFVTKTRIALDEVLR